MAIADLLKEVVDVIEGHSAIIERIDALAARVEEVAAEVEKILGGNATPVAPVEPAALAEPVNTQIPPVETPAAETPAEDAVEPQEEITQGGGAEIGSGGAGASA